jgi:prenyltransferase beta subunit
MKKVQVVSFAIVALLIAMPLVINTASANPGSRWDSLKTYMDNHYDDPVAKNGEGGFTTTGSTVSYLYPTVGAVMVYQEKDMLSIRPPVFDLVKAKNFTQKLQWKSGGESYDRWGAFSLYIAGPVSIRNTYWATIMWETLDQQTNIPGMEDVKSINATSALIYVNKTQTESGGFGATGGAAPDLLSTFYALHVLNVMTDMAQVPLDNWLWNMTTTVNWILSCRDGDAFKLSPASDIPSVSATAAALLALNEIQKLSVITPTDQQAIENWVLVRQVLTTTSDEYIGGFTESVLTNDTNLETTYFALQLLNLVGGIDSVNANAAANFILDCQAADGAWGIVPGTDTGSLFYAGLALQSLKVLDPAGSYINLLNQEDPNNPSPPLVDWRLLFIVIFIVAAFVIAILALRRD